MAIGVIIFAPCVERATKLQSALLLSLSTLIIGPVVPSIQHASLQNIATTLPPLVISALPRLIKHTSYIHKPLKHTPFYSSSTPSTFLVNPSTTVSTLNPRIKDQAKSIKVTTAVPHNFHVQVSSHGEDEISINAFPLPPMPTVPAEHHAALPEVVKTNPPFFREDLAQIPPPTDVLVGEIRQFVSHGLKRPQVSRLPTRPRPFRSISPKEAYEARLQSKLTKIKTVPLQKPYNYPMEVKAESRGSTRKLKDYGIYQSAQSRNFDTTAENIDNIVSASSSADVYHRQSQKPNNYKNQDELQLIQAAEEYSFDRLF